MFTPTPYSGFKAIRAGLIADTYLEVHRVRKMKKSFEYDVVLFAFRCSASSRLAMCREANVAAESRHDVEELARDPNVYNKLASSIAPEIYGHEDVKKALLLQVRTPLPLAGVQSLPNSSLCS